MPFLRSIPPPALQTRPEQFDFDTSLSRLPSRCTKSFGMLDLYEDELHRKAAPQNILRPDGQEALDDDNYVLTTERVVPYFAPQQRAVYTIEFEKGEDGIVRAVYPSGTSLANKSVNVAFLSAVIDGERERLVGASKQWTHSHLAAGQPTQFAGSINFNSNGRITSMREDFSLNTGHYAHPDYMRAEDDFSETIRDTVFEYDLLIEKKLQAIIDFPRFPHAHLDEVNTVPYAEDQSQRLREDFPDDTSSSAEM